MEYCKIGGRDYNVLVTDITESFDILFTEDTGRTLADGAPMFLTPIGTFFNYSVTFKRRNGYEEEYDDLFDYVSQPRSIGIPVSIAHNQTTLDFDAYVSKGSRKVKRIDTKTGKIYWDELTLNIIPIEAQVKFV